MTAIQTAIQVFAAHPRLLRPPAVIPRPDGGVHLEWTDVAPCLELGIEPDGVVTLLVQRGEDWDDHEFPSPGDHDLHELLGLVET